MKWLTNTYNPRLPDARQNMIYDDNIDKNTQWQHYLKWLEDKIIGDPKSAEVYTVDELKTSNLVGVYVKE